MSESGGQQELQFDRVEGAARPPRRPRARRASGRSPTSTTRRPGRCSARSAARRRRHRSRAARAWRGSLKALVLGVVAAAISAGVWYAIIELTGYELGHRGDRGRDRGRHGGARRQRGPRRLGLPADGGAPHLRRDRHELRAARDGRHARGAAEEATEEASASPRSSETILLVTAIAIGLALPVLQVTEGRLHRPPDRAASRSTRPGRSTCARPSRSAGPSASTRRCRRARPERRRRFRRRTACAGCGCRARARAARLPVVRPARARRRAHAPRARGRRGGRARRARGRGRPPGGSALELLPPEAGQAAQIRARLETLSRRIEQRGPGAAAPTPTSDGGAGRGRLGAQVGVLASAGLLAWKFKALILLALGKGKLFLAGLTKLPTLLSMAASVGVYWTIWGWRFALGLVASIYVHEMGHVVRAAPLRHRGVGADVHPRARRVHPLEAGAGDAARERAHRPRRAALRPLRDARDVRGRTSRPAGRASPRSRASAPG